MKKYKVTKVAMTTEIFFVEAEDKEDAKTAVLERQYPDDGSYETIEERIEEIEET